MNDFINSIKEDHADAFLAEMPRQPTERVRKAEMQADCERRPEMPLDGRGEHRLPFRLRCSHAKLAHGPAADDR